MPGALQQLQVCCSVLVRNSGPPELRIERFESCSKHPVRSRLLAAAQGSLDL